IRGTDWASSVQKQQFIQMDKRLAPPGQWRCRDRLVLKCGTGTVSPMSRTGARKPIFPFTPSMPTKFRYKAGLIFWLGILAGRQRFD
ncbi:hypothetical protein NLU14_21650, partial [Marinobacter sp. 71-i]